MKRSLCSSIALMLALAAPLAAKELERLEYRDDRVTLRADDTPLADVIDSLKRQSGAELHGTVPDRSVTASLDDVPLREALERLLGAESFALRYGDNGRLKKIELRGGPSASKGMPTAKPEKPGEDLGGHDGKTPAHWAAVLDGLRASVPVEGRLRDKAGKEKADWDFVLRTASQRDDPELRDDAIRAGVRAIESDPEMREGVVGSLLRMDDEQLAAYVRAMSRSVDEDDPIAFVKSIVRYSQDARLRSRARHLMRQLRTKDRAADGAA